MPFLLPLGFKITKNFAFIWNCFQKSLILHYDWNKT